MAFSTGTAADHVDLLAKLRAFALLNGWSDLYWDSSTWIGKGSGDFGTDEIIVEFGLYENSPTDSYNLAIRGAMGYRAGHTSLYTAPNRSAITGMAMWSNQMTYWFVGNGRRLIIVVKVSSKFFSAYAGFLRPIATDQQEPYPLFIGGSSPDQTLTWTSELHNSPWHAGVPAYQGRQIYTPGGRLVAYESSQPAGQASKVWPWSDANSVWPVDITECIGGGLPLRPALVYAVLANGNADFQHQTYGQMEGIYEIPGLGQSSESIVTIGGDSYLIVQSAALTGPQDFAAIKLV